jgi:uncharacterized ion transporter superfamily protein YfcC
MQETAPFSPTEQPAVAEKPQRIPHAFVILFCLAMVAALTTYLIPGGSYERAANADGRMLLVDGTYRAVEQTPIGFLDFFNAFFQGMSSGSSIIFFLIIVGGTFGVLRASNALDGLVTFALRKLVGREIYIIPVMMTFFAFCSATYGMIEGSIVYLVILLPLARRIGYDSLVATAIPLLGTAIGYSGSFINPFNVGIAQGIAGLPLFSGMGYRMICWVLLLALSIGYVMHYAHKIKKNPSKSLVYGRPSAMDVKETVYETPELTRQHVLILAVFILGLAAIIAGVSTSGWYLKEMAGVFFLLGLIAGLIARMSPNTIARTFTQGCKDMTEGALAVGFAYTIVVIIQQAHVIDTIIHFLSSHVQGLSSTGATLGMYGIQSSLNFLVTSGSGQAALTMPIMAPLADIAGVNRQVAVLAFQFGDGISNAFTPTAGWLMAGLTIAGVPWTTWARFILPLLVMLYALGAVLLVIANLFVWPL